jgi:UTP--glucose-1-phosphate uridylyltransferase
MKATKAVITAASPGQRTLPLQMLVDRDGVSKPVLTIIVEEALRAGAEQICVVVCPGDEEAYRAAAARHASLLQFVPQPAPRGYGHAVFCAREFVGDHPFLHIVGDHIFVGEGEMGCAAQLVQAAETNKCSVSGVQPTRENQLPYFGAVGGRRVPGTQDLYVIDQVMEKPTPTAAEQSLMVPGLRDGYYLCFFGMHVLSPAVMDLLARQVADLPESRSIGFSPVLDELARSERYLALEAQGRRYPIDVRYGLLTAQLALGLGGSDREEVLATLCELLAQRQLGRS